MYIDEYMNRGDLWRQVDSWNRASNSWGDLGFINGDLRMDWANYYRTRDPPEPRVTCNTIDLPILMVEECVPYLGAFCPRL